MIRKILFLVLLKNKNIDSDFDTSFYLENINQLKPISLSEKQVQKLFLDFYHNPLKDYESKELIVQDKEGNTKTYNERELTKLYQQRIKASYHPIELDKAILYP